MSATTDAIIAKSNKVRAEQHAKLLSEFIHATNEFVFVSLQKKLYKSVRTNEYYHNRVRRQTPKYIINIRYDGDRLRKQNGRQLVPHSIVFLGRYINNELTKASRRENRLGVPKYYGGMETFALPKKKITCCNMTIALTRTEYKALSKYVKVEDSENT
tara:strand:- start:136 stop:609 length:474 start_codon:yes stop_codon:yes gene_type:complete